MTTFQTKNVGADFGGLGVEAAQPPEPPSLLDSSKHNCNTPQHVTDRVTASTRRDKAISEETRRARRGRYCGKWTMVGLEDGKYKHSRHRCKGWSCPRCGHQKLRLVRARIADYSAEYKLRRLVTLTLDPKKLPSGLNQKEKVEYLRERWRGMRVYLRRKLGRSLMFISVLEFQQNGNPHLHVLVDTYLHKDWLSTSWQALGGGFTDIRFVDLHRVALYLSKYMSKEWLNEFPEGCRRITASRGIVFFDRSKQRSTWQLFRQPIDWFHQMAQIRDAGIETEEYTEQDGARELVYFVAGASIRWVEPQFMRTNKWREEDYLRKTGRRTRPARIRFSPHSGALESQPESVRYFQ